MPAWKPGQSGNLKGRPPGRSLLELLRRALDKDTIVKNPCPEGMNAGELFVESTIYHAVKGNATYGKEIWDRIEGKIPDAQPTPAVSVEEGAKRLKEKRAKHKKKDDKPTS